MKQITLRGKTLPSSPGRQPELPGGRTSPQQPLSAADKIRGWHSHPPVCCTAGSSLPSPDEAARELAGTPARRSWRAHTRCPSLPGPREDETPAWKPPRALQSSILDNASGSCSEARLEAELQRSSCRKLLVPDPITPRVMLLSQREREEAEGTTASLQGRPQGLGSAKVKRAKRQPAVHGCGHTEG